MSREEFVLQRVQPALTGLIDGSLSTHRPLFAFVAGVATAIGAGISMAFSEGLSDTGEITGRGPPAVRGSITGLGTFVGGILHTLPFLIPHYEAALIVAAIAVGVELVALAGIRARYFDTTFLRSFASVTVGGIAIAGVSAALGASAA